MDLQLNESFYTHRFLYITGYCILNIFEFPSLRTTSTRGKRVARTSYLAVF